MTIAEKLKSLSLLVGGFSALTHFLSIKQTLNVVGEKESVTVGDENIISVVMVEPTITVDVNDSKVIQTNITADELSVVVNDNNISIIEKDNPWQVAL